MTDRRDAEGEGPMELSADMAVAERAAVRSHEADVDAAERRSDADWRAAEIEAGQTGQKAREDAAPAAPGGDVRSVRQVVRAAMRGHFGPLLAAGALVNVLAFAAPVFVLQTYDRVIPTAGFETLKGLLLGVLALIAIDFVLREARARMIQHMALRVDVALTRAVYARLCRLPLRRLEAEGESDWRHRLRDVEIVRDGVAGPSVVMALDMPFVLVFLAVVAFAAPPLAALLLMLTPVYFGIALLSAWLVRDASKDELEASLERDRLASELVSARSTVKAFAAGDALRGRFEAAHAALIDSSVRRGSRVDGFTALGGSLATLTTVLMTTVGAIAIINLEMSIGALIAANMLAGRIVQPLTQLIGVWRGLERCRRSTERLDDLFAEPLEPAAPAVRRPRPVGEVRLDGVGYAYGAEGPTCLAEATLAFGPGRMLGIAGPNGSGKSTLLKIAQGLYAPSSGRVTLDGVDLGQFSPDERARWIGSVAQEPRLLTGTIRDAIAMGRPFVDDAAVLAAAEAAGAARFIDASPDGYGASIGEGGGMLSSGQRQRLAIARALAGDPPVLLLDEPSAHLDAEAERALGERLTALKAGRAIALVTHAPALLALCDQIAIVDGGRVKAVGPSDVMIARMRGAPRPPTRRAVGEAT